jgi:hypothetical protein
MRSRRWWLGLACFPLLVGATSLALVFVWPGRTLTQAELRLCKECFGRIELGRPYEEIHALLEGYGFQRTEQRPFEDEVLVKYELAGKGVAILLLFEELNGPASYKEFKRAEGIGSFIERLWRRLTSR